MFYRKDKTEVLNLKRRVTSEKIKYHPENEELSMRVYLLTVEITNLFFPLRLLKMRISKKDSRSSYLE